MSSISSNSSRGIISSSGQNQPVERERYRTCCDCCHIKTGTLFLGLLEFSVLAALLYGIVQQLVWKSATYTRGACASHILRDCLLLDFSHFSLTLIFDYIIALLLVVVLFSIVLMFCGIFSDTACLLFPHLFVQAIFLLFSVGYFVLYAWSYFYGDLYTHRRSFEIQSCFERMWLASVLLILASFQVYLFFAVFKCSLYLAKIDYSRRQRETAFQRLSERVRIAKENGLWRQSGVGGFLSYTRQEEDEKRKKEKQKIKPVGHVQWSNENKVVLLDEDPSRSEATPSSFRPNVQFTQPVPQKTPVYAFQPVIEDLPAEPRRRSTDTIESRDNYPNKGKVSSTFRNGSQPGQPVLSKSAQPRLHSHDAIMQVKRADSREKKPKGDTPVKIPLDDEYMPATPPSPVRRKSSREEILKEASHAAIAYVNARKEKVERELREAEKELREAEKSRTSSSSSPEKEFKERSSSTTKAPKRSEKRDKALLTPETGSGSEKHSPVAQPHHHHHHHHSIPSTSYDRGDGRERRDSDIATDERRRGSRGLRKLRSVDSSEYDVPEEVFERRMKSRRRSSDAGRATGEERSHKHKRDKERDSGNPPSPSERKPHDSSVIVKKISISATVSPFA